MKKAIGSVLAAVCVVGGGASALAVDVPWFNSFEDADVGTSIVTNDSMGTWLGDPDVVAVVTNVDYGSYIQSPKVSYPLSTTHSKVVSFKDGGISNLVNGAGQDKVWVDVMLQPIRMEQPTLTPAISNSQMSLFVNTDGYLCVYHSVLETEGDWTPTRQAWTVLDDGMFPPIGTDKWVRLTVNMDYSQYGTYNLALFQVTVNGHTFTNALGYQDGDLNSTVVHAPGSWFVCANNAQSLMSQVAFSGSGMFDDLVITNGAVSYEAGLPLIVASANQGGSISPVGTVALLSTPGTTNFTIAANPFFHIAGISTGEVSTAGNMITAATGATAYDVEMTVTVDSFITATFAPDLAANNTPKWWLNQYGLTNDTANWDAQALADSDNDGAFNWQEYVAGTIPVNQASVLKVIEQQFSGATTTIKWMNSTDALGPYVISASSNLVGWTTLNGPVVNAGNTNSFNTVAPVGPLFYRVSITNY